MPRAHRLSAQTGDGENTLPGTETVGSPTPYINDPTNAEFDKSSIGQSWKAPIVPGDFQPTTRDRNFVPYRGQNRHGIDFNDVDVHNPTVLGTLSSVQLDNAPVVDHAGEITQDEFGPTPILVKIDETPPPQIEKRWDTNTAIIPAPVAGASTWVPLFGKRHSRIQCQIVCKPQTLGQTGRVWIVPENGHSIETGYPMDVNDNFTFQTTEQAWVVADPANANAMVVAYVDEYEVDLGYIQRKERSDRKL